MRQSPGTHQPMNVRGRHQSGRRARRARPGSSTRRRGRRRGPSSTLGRASRGRRACARRRRRGRCRGASRSRTGRRGRRRARRRVRPRRAPSRSRDGRGGASRPRRPPPRGPRADASGGCASPRRTSASRVCRSSEGDRMFGVMVSRAPEADEAPARRPADTRDRGVIPSGGAAAATPPQPARSARHVGLPGDERSRRARAVACDWREDSVERIRRPGRSPRPPTARKASWRSAVAAPRAQWTRTFRIGTADRRCRRTAVDLLAGRVDEVHLGRAATRGRSGRPGSRRRSRGRRRSGGGP